MDQVQEWDIRVAIAFRVGDHEAEIRLDERAQRLLQGQRHVHRHRVQGPAAEVDDRFGRGQTARPVPASQRVAHLDAEAEAHRGQVDHRHQVEPEAEAQEDAHDEGERGPVLPLLGPARGEPEGPGA